MNEVTKNQVDELFELDEYSEPCGGCCTCRTCNDDSVPAGYYEAEARYYEELEAERKLGLWD